MTDLSPEGIVRGMFAALNSRDYARAAGAVAEHCEWNSLGSGAVFQGPWAMIDGLREFVAAFPDWRADLERVTTAGPMVKGVVVLKRFRHALLARQPSEANLP